MEYTVDYFIKKFEAIPEERWTTGTFLSYEEERRCALGHCFSKKIIWKLQDAGMKDDGSTAYPITEKEKQTSFKEAYVLSKLFCENAREGSQKIIDVNNGLDSVYQQLSPKQRIFAALYDIKAKISPYQSSVSRELAEKALDTVKDNQDCAPVRKEVEV